MVYDEETIKLFAVSKWGWIKDNIAIVQKQKRIALKEYISGESHYLFGKRYRFKFIEGNQSYVEIKGVNHIVMTAKASTSRDAKQKLMDKWYREQLKTKLMKMLPKWEEKTGLSTSGWTIKKMKTKWETCNPQNKTLVFNSELAKYSTKNIEYIILHELSHLIEHTHNRNFIAHIEKYMPNWQSCRNDLNKVTFE